MHYIQKHYKKILFAIPIVSLILHSYVFRLDLVGIHVWRQTETQQMIDNFYREDFNILHPRVNNLAYPDRKLMLEFPLMQWVFAVFFKLFGSHIIISRILSFLIGLFSACGVFYFSRNVFRDNAVATICTWCFYFSPVFYYYTLNPMPDNLALCMAIWSLGLFYSYHRTSEIKYVLWSAVCFSISVMAKLPFIVYSAFIAGCLLVDVKEKKRTATQVSTIASVYLAITAPAILWYATVMPTWGSNVVLKGMLDAHETCAQLFHIISGVVISVLPELLVNYGALLFFVGGTYFFVHKRVHVKQVAVPFMIWGGSVIAYFLFEMNAIGTVHDYYMLPFLPPIFLVVAYGASGLLTSKLRPLRVLSVVCLAILPFTAFLRAYSRWDIASDTGFASVFYKYKDEIRRLSPPDARCVVGNDQSDMILLYYIDRKGWTFDKEMLDAPTLTAYINKGAQYLYTTGPVDSRPEIKVHLDKKIFDRESLRVYKLK